MKNYFRLILLVFLALSSRGQTNRVRGFGRAAESPERESILQTWKSTKDDSQFASATIDMMHKTKPEIADDILRADQNTFQTNLGQYRKALADKKCAGQPCSEDQIYGGLIDIWFRSRMDNPLYLRLQNTQIRDQFEDSGYLQIWSKPTATFRMDPGKPTELRGPTPKEGFVPKGKHVVEITLEGYEPYKNPECNVTDDGVRCGANLKKKP